MADVSERISKKMDEGEMPSIVIDVDGTRVATIDLAGMQIIDVSVHGGLDGEQKATLGAMGGNYAVGACGHLIWIDERPVLPKEVICVSLSKDCDSADRGKKIDELYPNEAPSTKTDFTINDEMAAELRARPRLHDAFIVQAGTSSGALATAVSDDLNTNFRFGLLWDWLHPDQARLSLRTTCLEDFIKRSGGTEHLETLLAVGESTQFSLVK